MFRCRMVADSFYSTRITTLEVTYPRFIHSEVLTHRDRARNAGSSRAIPWPVMCERIENDPVIPIYWGANKSGMQTGEEIPKELQALAREIWLEARDDAVKHAKRLHKIGYTWNRIVPHKPMKPEYDDIGIHKSLVNRLTEPFMYITVVMTATEWKNFFDQRCHPDAEIHFQKIANMMKEVIEKSVPKYNAGWHLPYIEENDHVNCPTIETLKLVSVARCARVSYVQHGEKAKSVDKDLKLAQDLIHGSGEMGHRSPFEMVAFANPDPDYRSGPFFGWKQLRKDYWNE